MKEAVLFGRLFLLDTIPPLIQYRFAHRFNNKDLISFQKYID